MTYNKWKNTTNCVSVDIIQNGFFLILKAYNITKISYQNSARKKKERCNCFLIRGQNRPLLLTSYVYLGEYLRRDYSDVK